MADRKQYMKEWRQKNKEYRKQYSKQWAVDNKEHRKQYKKQYYIDNKEHYKQYKKQYNQENREHIRQRKKQHYQENKEHYKQYEKQKYKTDLKFNLNNRMSCAIWNTLKGNKMGRHWEDLVGYTVDDLIKHLKKTMPESYTWQDFLNGKLHIDHIIAKKYFNFTRPEHIDFKNCWSLSNLQLLPAEENFKKNAKLYKPFQPALKLAYLVKEV